MQRQEDREGYFQLNADVERAILRQPDEESLALSSIVQGLTPATR